MKSGTASLQLRLRSKLIEQAAEGVTKCNSRLKTEGGTILNSKTDALRSILYAEVALPGLSRAVVVSQVKKAIETGALPPGSRVKQQDIADIFNISRMPVREALRILEVQGYLINTPHCGYQVCETFPDSHGSSMNLVLEPLRREYQVLTDDDQREAFERDVLQVLRTPVLDSKRHELR